MDFRPFGALVLWMLVSASATLAGQDNSAACDASIRSEASTTSAKVNSCVVKRGDVLLETSYYQNASRVGGSALAAYPDARVTAGVATNIEGFVDTPTEIAKSGFDGRGIYTMAPSGYGLKAQLGETSDFSYSLQAEERPPLDTMAPMTLRPMLDVALTGGWTSPTDELQANVQVGALKYGQGTLRARGTTEMLATSLSTPLSPETALTAQLQTFTKPESGASAQTRGTLGLSRALGTDALFGVEIGTAFNAIRQSKAHYLAAGFTLR